MELDLMVSPSRWDEAADFARSAQDAGISGLVFVETAHTPWMSITAASMAAPELHFATGIAVAFPRSPMMAASMAWELADNTNGKFRLGLGSQVKAHVERRYSAEFDSPGPRLKEYVEAIQACFRAFRGEERLSYEGKFYNLSLLPAQWSPSKHAYGDVKVDVSAVGPWMSRMAGEVADGVHVHPLHSIRSLQEVLIPRLEEGAARAERDASDIDLIVPVFAVVGDSPDEQAASLDFAEQQIGFYGSTRDYAFQFELLGFDGLSAKLNERLKAGDIDGMKGLITPEVMQHFSVTASWADLADKLVDRYAGIASRLVMYSAQPDIKANPQNMSKWGATAERVREG